MLVKLTNKEVSISHADVFLSGKALVLWDTELRGFGVRLGPANTRYPNGKISYVVQKRQGGRGSRQIRFTFDAEDVNAARNKALSLLSEIRNGGNPQQERKSLFAQRRLEYANYKTLKFKDLFEKWRTSKSDGSRYWEKYILYNYRKHVLPTFGDRAITEITKDDIRALLASVPGKSMPKQVEGQLKPFFKWLMQEDIITKNPFDGLVALPKLESRDRVLTKDELIAFWRATGDIINTPKPIYGYMYRTLLLTGARLREIAHLQTDELEFQERRITVGAKRSKNKQVHIIPLGDLAIETLGSTPRKSNQHVFSYGHGSLNGFTVPKEILDREMRKYLGDKFKPWRIHDFRKTFASIMAEQGCSGEIIDRCLGHVSQMQEGVRGVYQRYQFMKERIEVMTKWNDYIAKLCS